MTDRERTKATTSQWLDYPLYHQYTFVGLLSCVPAPKVRDGVKAEVQRNLAEEMGG